MRTPAPDPGLYQRTPDAEYRAWDATSATFLKAMEAQSPAHARYAEEHPSEPTEALALGQAVHTILLEPEKFVDKFAIAPECDRRTTAGKAMWAEFTAANAGKTILKADAAQVIDGIAKAVAGHPLASRTLLLDAGDSVELSAVWMDKATGVKCKARADALRAGAGVLVDIKTTRDASREAFRSDARRLRYDLQFAHYMAGLAACGVALQDVAIIAVETEPPHGVAVYRIEDNWLVAAEARRQRLLEQVAECRASGVWPAYSAEAIPLAMPDWLARRNDLLAV